MTRCHHHLLFALTAIACLAMLGPIAAHAQQTTTGTELLPEPAINEPAPGTLIVHPADNALMAYVPRGWFVMGVDVDEAIAITKLLNYESYHKIAAEEWMPRRLVFVDGFFIDVHEVSIARWKAFIELSKYEPKGAARHPESNPAGAFDQYPVGRISWQEAQVYANWMGKHLPTEAQWEKAARGTDGRWFPWGNAAPTKDRGALTRDIMQPENGTAGPYPVGSFPKGASPYGVMDMAGNVYEWTSEWMEPYPNNPEFQRLLSYTGHTNGLLRGGSFYHARHALVSAKRFGFPPDETHFHVGMRTVWQPPADYFSSPAFKEHQAKVDKVKAQLDEARKNSGKAPYHY